ncbi:MAG TPA: hypothetical protein VMT53_00530 [Terriglobales bacterium]|nr:hypothetical protein [Terriglobales bacterium]
MTGIHSTRLAASKAHRSFVAGTRKAVKKMGWEIPNPLSVSPSIVGAQMLSFPVPPTLERAFGYRADLRFLEFGYSVRSRQFGYCDGADDIPSDESLWLWFLSHPVISTHLPENRYPTLYGVSLAEADRPAIEEVMRRGRSFDSPHCLLLDRRDRKAYISKREQTMILFALMEPEGADHHSVFVDGLLMSSGTEDYKVPPPVEFVHQLRSFLDAQLDLAHRGGQVDLGQ